MASPDSQPLPERLSAVLRVRPSGLALDLDGTLSHIAPTPQQATVPHHVRQALSLLKPQIDVLVVLSGRPAAEAKRLVGVAGVTYVGNHGFDWIADGEVVFHPAAKPYLAAIETVLARLERRLAGLGLLFEKKGPTASIHFRQAADPDAARKAILAAVAKPDARRQLRVTEGRMVVNLLPPVLVDKGTSLVELAARHRLKSLVFFGDDVTDVDGFRALHDLRIRGLTTLSIAVVSEESPRALTELADQTVSGPDEVLRVLDALRSV